MTALTVADVEQAGGFLGTTPRVRYCDVSWCDNPERRHTLHVAALSVVDDSRSQHGPTIGYVFLYQDSHGDRTILAFTWTPDVLQPRPLDGDLDEWWKPVVERAIKWRDATRKAAR
jgi:hypothetical protein